MKKYYQLIVVILTVALFPVVNANARDKVRIGGNVVVEEGTEVKDAVAVGGSVTVNGKVRQSAVAVGGSVVLGPNAVVGKDVVSIGGGRQTGAGLKNSRQYRRNEYPRRLCHNIILF